MYFTLLEWIIYTDILLLIQGFENHDSGVGIYAPDAEAYTVFSGIFDPIIEDYHKGFKSTDKHPAKDWGDVSTLGDLDPEVRFFFIELGFVILEQSSIQHNIIIHRASSSFPLECVAVVLWKDTRSILCWPNNSTRRWKRKFPLHSLGSKGNWKELFTPWPACLKKCNRN